MTILAARIPQADAKAAAARLLAHRQIEAATGAEYELVCRPLKVGRYTDPITAMNDAVGGFGHRMRMHASLSGCCGLCGLPIDTPAKTTYDHVVPRSLGGGNYGNLIPAHADCNSRKGSRLPTGCEIISLAAVNAYFGVVSRTISRGRTKATLADVFPRPFNKGEA